VRAIKANHGDSRKHPCGKVLGGDWAKGEGEGKKNSLWEHDTSAPGLLKVKNYEMLGQKSFKPHCKN